MARISISPLQIRWLQEQLKRKLDHHPKMRYGAHYDTYLADVEKINKTLEAGNFQDLGEFDIKKLRCTTYILQRVFYTKESEINNPKNFNPLSLAILTLFISGKVQMDIPEYAENDIESEGSSILSHFLTDIQLYQKISDTDIQEAISQSKKEIRIIETYLENWFQLREHIKKAVSEGVKVKIILSDPWGEMVKLRYKGLRLPTHTTKAEDLLHEMLEYVKNWKNHQQIEIRISDHIPGLLLYGFDQNFYIGWFWQRRAATQGTILCFSDRTMIGETTNKHFSRLWKASNPIDLDIFLAIQKKNSHSNNLNLDSYLGTWYLYCNRRTDKTESYKINTMRSGLVARNLFEINKETDGSYSCAFSSQYLPDHYGTVSLAENNSFIICELCNEDKTSWLSFTFHKGSGLSDNLIGIFNNMYAQEPILGSGIVFLERATPSQLIPLLIDPFYPGNISENASKIVRYLCHTLGSRLEPIKDIDELNKLSKYAKPFPYEGVYHVYSYDREENSKKYSSQKIYLKSRVFILPGSKGNVKPVPLLRE